MSEKLTYEELKTIDEHLSEWSTILDDDKQQVELERIIEKITRILDELERER